MRIEQPTFSILNPCPLDGAEMLQRIEAAGRTCYKSEAKATSDSAAKFVRMVIARGHESVLEHESVSVRIVCDRGVSHELVRHRLAAFSQESTRYCNYGKGGPDGQGEVTFIRPPFWDDETRGVNRASFDVWLKACEVAEKAYLDLLVMGATPQEARAVLPNSLKTEIVITANLREWRHIFRLRTAKAAHPQMRQVMVPMLRVFRSFLPAVFEGIEVDNG